MRLIYSAIWILICFTLNAAERRVCTTCTYQSVESAYEACIDGDTIVIQKGTYDIDKWEIRKKISVIGEDGATLNSSSGGEMIIVLTSYVTIENLHFTGVKTNYIHEDAAIRIKDCRHYKILNNVIDDCFFAIYIERSHDGLISGNILDGDASTEAESGNGVHAWYSNNITITKNNISHHRDGIYLEFVNESKVHSNHSHDNTRYGLHFMFSNDDTYSENTFEKNGVGVAVMFSRRITMKYNNFINNWGNAAYGLLLKEIYDAEIVNNKFQQNTVGIFIEGSNRINYLNNVFKRNGWAIKFSGGCEANIISHNQFLHNSIDLVVSSQLNDNSFNHNYWSEYAGYDLDKDGVGDVPHYPVKLYSYILNEVPESVVLLRSLFVDIINFAEKVSPVFTPKDVKDDFPIMSVEL